LTEGDTTRERNNWEIDLFITPIGFGAWAIGGCPRGAARTTAILRAIHERWMLAN
jgi:hypothetical protein